MATGGGCTLAQIRAWVAQELGTFVSSTASSSSTTAELVDTAWPIKSNLSQDDLYADYYLLRPTASAAEDRVRVVQTYAPTTGTLTPDLGWTNAPGSGEAYELHGIIEPATALVNAINEALKRLMVVVEVTLTPVANQQRQLLDLTWLTDSNWIRKAGWLATNEDRNQVSPYFRAIRGEPLEDGATGNIYLNHPGFAFTGTETIYLLCCKRAYDHVAPSGGSNFGTQSGLTLDGDTAPVDVEWIGWATLVEAWRRYGSVLETASRARMLPNRQEAAQMLSKLTADYFQPPPQSMRPIYYGGPRQRQGGFFGSPW